MRIVRIKMAVMIVCVCHQVSDRDIAHAARHGCPSYDELQEQLRVGTACGACGDCARNTFEAQRRQRCSTETAAISQVSWIGRGAAHTPLSMAAAQPAGMS
jgi:bacterioferritin-associated ferredoxin